MTKLLIFDLDGCLVHPKESRELHYKALNRALESIDPKYVINRDEHLTKYDGLPTTKKLNMLTEEKGLPKDLHNEVWKKKQQMTIDIINKEMEYDYRIREVLARLKNDGLTLCVASNSIRETVRAMLIRKGFMEYIDWYYGNDEVCRPKPSTSMYLECMLNACADPVETIILEDSHVGRRAAMNSGAHLMAVVDSDDIIYDNIKKFITSVNEKGIMKPKWQGGDLNVLIPAAGAGSRFANVGYRFPKPLIEVHNKTMIQVVVENLNIDSKHIFIVQRDHYEKFHLKPLLNLISPDCGIIQTEGVTEGAACTTLLAKYLIDNDSPLLIANSDQFIENWDSNEFLYSMQADNIDGGILTFEASHPKWSYVKTDENGYVTEVREKEVISNEATIGIYYWTKGSDYVKYAEEMIENDIRVNGEFFTAPVYNQAIADGKKIKTFKVKNNFYGLGTPNDLEFFLKHYKGKI